MDLLSKIDADFKAAMLAKDETKKSALRLLKASITNEAKAHGKELSQDDLFKVVEKNVKSIDKQIQVYQDLNQMDLVNSLNVEKSIIAQYLPQYISEEELDSVIEIVFANLEQRVMGYAIRKVTEQLGGQKVDRAQMVNKIQQKLNA